jgi:hypothetical protein
MKEINAGDRVRSCGATGTVLDVQHVPVIGYYLGTPFVQRVDEQVYVDWLNRVLEPVTEP